MTHLTLVERPRSFGPVQVQCMHRLLLSMRSFLGLGLLLDWICQLRFDALLALALVRKVLLDR